MNPDYDANANVRKLEEDFGAVALQVLNAWNAVDPLSCFYGNDLNPDEYAGYARRFMYHINHETNILDAVTKSFWSNQVSGDENDIYPDIEDNIVRIAALIRQNNATPWR